MNIIELTPEQLERQELVDSAIHSFLDTVFPNENSEWDDDAVGSFRDFIVEWALGEGKADSEMEIYPFEAEEGDVGYLAGEKGVTVAFLIKKLKSFPLAHTVLLSSDPYGEGTHIPLDKILLPVCWDGEGVFYQDEGFTADSVVLYPAYESPSDGDEEEEE